MTPFIILALFSFLAGASFITFLVGLRDGQPNVIAGGAAILIFSLIGTTFVLTAQLFPRS